MTLLHNWTIHRSGVNTSQTMARRAFSVNYMCGSTRISNPGALDAGLAEEGTGYAEGADTFPVIFGAVAEAEEGKLPARAPAPSSPPTASNTPTA